MEPHHQFRHHFLAFAILLSIQVNAQTPDSAATSNDTLKSVSGFVKALQQVGKEETQRSIKKYQSGINTIRQQKLLDELRLTIQKVKILLARGLDTTYIKNELDKTTGYINLTKDGIFEHKGTIQTQRNLAVSSVILTELSVRVKKIRAEVSDYGKTLMSYRNYIDSIYTDSVLYTFPDDSLATIKYITKLRLVVQEINPSDSALEKAVFSIPELQNKIDEIAFRIDSSLESIEHFSGELTENNFKRELHDIYAVKGFSRPIQEILHFSFAKEKLALKFYFKENFERIFILILVFFAAAVLLNTLKSKAIEEKVTLLNNAEPLVLKYPNLSACIIVISIFQFLLHEPPFIFSYTLWAIAVISLSLIFRGVLSTYWMRFWLFTLLLFLIAGANNMVLQASRSERWMMLIIALLGAVYGLFILSNGKRKELKERKILYFVGFMIVFELAAAIYNFYGRYNLSKTLFVSGFIGLELAILFLWTARLLNEALGVTSKVFRHPEKRLFYINFEKIGNRVPLIFYLFLIAGWVILVGKQFYSFSQVSKSFNSFLNAERTIGNYTFSVNGLFIFLIILFVSVLLSKIVSFFSSDPDINYTSPEERKKVGLGSWLLIVQILIISLGIFLAFAGSGIPIDKITIILGALSVGIGLGLQGLVNNLVSGLIIAFEKPVNVGDVIELDGKPGTMKSIGFRSSVVNMSDGQSIIIPNGDLLSQQLVNWSMGKGNRKVTILIGVAYGTDLEKVIRLIGEIIKSDKGILHKTAPAIVPLAFGANAIEMEVSFIINNFREAGMVKGRVITEIQKRFSQEGIEIPMPQQGIHIRSINHDAK